MSEGPIQYFQDEHGPFYLRKYEDDEYKGVIQTFEEGVAILKTLYNLHLFEKTETPNEIRYELKSRDFSKVLRLVLVK